jgi:cholesterol oxidase
MTATAIGPGDIATEWPRLAADPGALDDDYDVVIVGSGYGGAITAARLGFANARSGRGLRIAVLERGSEHPTGTGPETQAQLMGEIRSGRNPLGFYEVLRFDTIDVIKGNALGGGSLNNFNVAIVPDREVFLESWPAAVREEVKQAEDGVGHLEEYYERAKLMLGANPWRDGQGLKKAAVIDELAEHAGSTGETLNLTVSTEDRVTRYGVRRARCINCGDCAMICNVGAKNTLMTNYLPMARHFGVELFDRVEVDRIADRGRLPAPLRAARWRSGPRQNRSRDHSAAGRAVGRITRIDGDPAAIGGRGS